MPKSYFLDNSFINAALRQTPYTSPLAVYVALFTVAPTAAGGGTEVVGGGYLRQPATFGPPVNGQSVTTADVLYPIATAAWGTIVAFGVYDAALGGNLLYFNSLSSPRNVQINDQVRFPSAQLICSEA